MPLYHRRKTPGVREYRRSFGNDAGYPAKQCGGYQIALACNPAGVGNDIHHVAWPRVERHLHRVRDARSVAAMDVHDSLGFARRARGVDKKHWIFGINRQWR